MNERKERRVQGSIRLRSLEENNEGGGRLVEGYALLFNTESKDLGGFTEIIEPGALDRVIESSDVYCLLNHDHYRGLLARSTNGVGSLHLEVDDKGLKYSFEAPKTALGDELLEGLRRGDIRESSFAFDTEEEAWEDKGGAARCIIKKIRQLYDVSPVYNPAYAGTEVSARKRAHLEALHGTPKGIRQLITELRGVKRKGHKDNIKRLIKDLKR